jgi:hypothetical protein
MLLRKLYYTLCSGTNVPYKAPFIPRPSAPAVGAAFADMETRVGDMHRICKVIENNGLEAYRYAIIIVFWCGYHCCCAGMMVRISLVQCVVSAGHSSLCGHFGRQTITTCRYYVSSLRVITTCHHYLSLLLVITTCHHYLSSLRVITTCHHYLSSLLVITTCHHYLSCNTRQH